MRVHVDFETRSTVDLRTRGSTIYAQHWTTSPLMLAVVTDSSRGVFDFINWLAAYKTSIYPACSENDPFLHAYKPTIPGYIKAYIDADAVFVAHNARFEQDIWWWICHKRWGWPMPRRWSCTAARARYWGLRASLDGCASDLELPLQKMDTDFIKTFCIPRKYKGPKKNGIITELWAEPHELPRQWEEGIEYCLNDALVEQQIDNMLPDLPDFEQRVWELDFNINTHGIPIDTDNLAKAIHFSDHYAQHALQRFNAITSYNPTQRDRVLEYLNQREEMEKLSNLRSKTLNRIVQNDLPFDLRDVINIRLDSSRASVKKLEAMRIAASPDNRARGTFLYYGAHTGRWSAKRLQPHNFIRSDGKPASIMFKYLASGTWNMGLSNSGMPDWVDTADVLFPRPLKTLAESMRGFIKAPDGQIIISGDYSQIEARVLAWLANCATLLHSFSTKEDVYVRFAADYMYRRQYTDYFGGDSKVLPSLANERQMAKSAVLGCGFQLGTNGFQEYCDNLDIIISEDEAAATIKAYRSAYPEISDYNTGLWARVNWCAIQAVDNEGQTIQLYGTPITFHVYRIDQERWWLICTLPSGRHIAYYRPKTDTINQWGKPVLSYRTEWMGKTYREQTYGGKLVENIVQGVARDICAIGALNSQSRGFNVFMLVHDEIVTLCNDDNTDNNKIVLKQCLLDLPAWCEGLPLDADIKAMHRYSK